MPPLAVQLPAAVQLIVTIAELSVEALLASTATPKLVGLELLASNDACRSITSPVPAGSLRTGTAAYSAAR